MTRQELIRYVFDAYSVEPDYPFARDDVTCVFRHIDNRKWFGIAMVVPYRTVGINREGNVDILNVKCDPIMMGSLCGKPGFCPAYHIRIMWRISQSSLPVARSRIPEACTPNQSSR